MTNLADASDFFQHPHVHEWVTDDGTPYHGLLADAPHVTCECGDQAGPVPNP